MVCNQPILEDTVAAFHCRSKKKRAETQTFATPLYTIVGIFLGVCVCLCVCVCGGGGGSITIWIQELLNIFHLLSIGINESTTFAHISIWFQPIDTEYPCKLYTYPLKVCGTT